MAYTTDEHIHRFALWTAVRASQRGWLDSTTISEALEEIDIRKYHKILKKNANLEYDFLHKELCNKLIESKKLKQHKPAFGRAAKVIAIYFKTAIVIPERGEGELINKIYPPIDSILLENLAKKFIYLSSLKNYKWTQISEKEHNDIKGLIIGQGLTFNWKLEEYWNLNNT